jgi:Zn-dependent protease
MPLNLALVLFELVIMALAISLHDCAQAWAANRLGDPTARMMGRLTLNPVKHFDLFGMAVWPLLFIWRSSLILGWGKPVPMTERNFRRGSHGEMLSTLAGPAAQFGAAIACLVLLLLLKHAIPGAAESLGTASALAQRNLGVSTEGLPGIFPLVLVLYLTILVNLLLCVFNLMPLPFLDGGKILVHYLPYNAARTYESIGLYLMFGFMFLGFGIILMIFLPLLSLFNALLDSL